MILESFDLVIPWRKVRRFAEIHETKTIKFEILVKSKTFAWVEFKTLQGTYLLQLVGEYIETMNRKMKPPVFKQPKFVTEADEVENKKKGTITFALIKKEIFGMKDKKTEDEQSYFEDFNAIDDIELSENSVSNSDSEEEDEDDSSYQASQTSQRGSIASPASPKNVDDCEKPGGPSILSAGYLRINDRS